MRMYPLLGCALAAVVVAGCARTDRTVATSRSDVTFETPRQIQPPGAILSCLSSDGRYYAVLIPVGETFRLEVRRSDNGQAVYSQEMDANKEALPALFLNRGRELACLTEVEGSLEVLDWGRRSWRTLPAVKGMIIGGLDFASPSLVTLTNDRASMIFLGSCVLTESGVVTPVRDGRAPAGWDPNGDFVYQERGAWTRIDATGREFTGQHPARVDPSPLSTRADIRLVDDSQVTERSGSQAFVTGIWADPREPRAASGQKGASALAFVGYDVNSFGFVPGHDSVFVNSDGGAYFVPYRAEPTIRDAPAVSPGPD